MVATTTTDASGEYHFNALAAGQYQIQVMVFDGEEVSSKDQGSDDTKDSDVYFTGLSDLLQLSAGNQLDIDAGLYLAGASGGGCGE